MNVKILSHALACTSFYRNLSSRNHTFSNFVFGTIQHANILKENPIILALFLKPIEGPPLHPYVSLSATTTKTMDVWECVIGNSSEFTTTENFVSKMQFSSHIWISDVRCARINVWVFNISETVKMNWIYLWIGHLFVSCLVGLFNVICRSLHTAHQFYFISFVCYLLWALPIFHLSPLPFSMIY